MVQPVVIWYLFRLAHFAPLIVTSGATTCSCTLGTRHVRPSTIQVHCFLSDGGQSPSTTSQIVDYYDIRGQQKSLQASKLATGMQHLWNIQRASIGV
jgi:hypothetical protein